MTIDELFIKKHSSLKFSLSVLFSLLSVCTLYFSMLTLVTGMIGNTIHCVTSTNSNFGLLLVRQIVIDSPDFLQLQY